MKSYYILEMIQENDVYYVLWYTNGQDGFVLNKGRWLSFATMEAVQYYCAKMNISPEREKEQYGPDGISEYLAGNRVTPDGKVLLNF